MRRREGGHSELPGLFMINVQRAYFAGEQIVYDSLDKGLYVQRAYFAGEQTGYGSLDRGLLRRSRGRNRPGLLQAELERDR